MLPRALCTSGSGCSGSLRAAAASRSRAALAAPVRHLLALGSSSSIWRGSRDRLGVAPAAQQRRPAASALEALAEADGAPDTLQPPPTPRPHLRHPGSHLHLAAQPRPLTEEHPHPGIEIFMGPMFAGKTTALLRRVAELEAKGFNVAVVKSSKDDRYCNSSVVTHNGLKRVRQGVEARCVFLTRCTMRGTCRCEAGATSTHVLPCCTLPARLSVPKRMPCPVCCSRALRRRRCGHSARRRGPTTHRSTSSRSTRRSSSQVPVEECAIKADTTGVHVVFHGWQHWLQRTPAHHCSLAWAPLCRPCPATCRPAWLLLPATPGNRHALRFCWLACWAHVLSPPARRPQTCMTSAATPPTMSTSGWCWRGWMATSSASALARWVQAEGSCC